jgi:osmotically inducible protein OsmC
MPTRKANALWTGTAKEGSGKVAVGSGALEAPYSFSSRFEEGPGTNPEELVGAAHAGCFSMALSLGLTEAGYPPKSIETQARVTIDKQGEGFSITGIELDTTAEVPEIDRALFMQHAETAKEGCPVSKALAGTEISLNATLK